jgi:hypothetical protein
MYYPDLTPYTYSEARLPGDASSLVNFGWLDTEHEYACGEPGSEAVESCLRLAARYMNAMRGFHPCLFCGNGEMVSMSLDGEPIYLGHAEVRITVGSTTFVGPSLVPHYMAVHGYMPPGEVLSALSSAE